MLNVTRCKAQQLLGLFSHCQSLLWINACCEVRSSTQDDSCDSPMTSSSKCPSYYQLSLPGRSAKHVRQRHRFEHWHCPDPKLDCGVGNSMHQDDQCHKHHLDFRLQYFGVLANSTDVLFSLRTTTSVGIDIQHLHRQSWSRGPLISRVPAGSPDFLVTDSPVHQGSPES